MDPLDPRIIVAQVDAIRARASTRARSANSLASLLGLSEGASEIAIKTAIARKLKVFNYAARVTGTEDEARMLGKLRALAPKIAAKRAEAEQRRRVEAEAEQRRRAEEELERWRLPHRAEGNATPSPETPEAEICSTCEHPRSRHDSTTFACNATSCGCTKYVPENEHEPAPVPGGPEKTSAFAAYAFQAGKPEQENAPRTTNGIDPRVRAAIMAREFPKNAKRTR